jgi:hypothetical protein
MAWQEAHRFTVELAHPRHCELYRPVKEDKAFFYKYTPLPNQIAKIIPAEFYYYFWSGGSA